METLYCSLRPWGGTGRLASVAAVSPQPSTPVCVCAEGQIPRVQPYIIATLMVIVLFLLLPHDLRANPFATSVAGGASMAKAQSLLQNFYMIILPQSLHGFVDCFGPFSRRWPRS